MRHPWSSCAAAVVVVVVVAVAGALGACINEVIVPLGGDGLPPLDDGGGTPPPAPPDDDPGAPPGDDDDEGPADPPAPPPPPPPPPAPPDGGDAFDDAAPIECGQVVTGNVGADAPEWYSMDTSARSVSLTLDAPGDVDVDLHVTDGPAVPGDVVVASESPTGHEEVELSDAGVVGVRVLLYAGALSVSFTLTVACDSVGQPPPPPVEPEDPPAPPPPTTMPPDLECIGYAAQNARAPAGTALRDIVRHLPDDQVDYYCDPDVVTCAHEVSHGIHAHLRNYYNPNSARSNAFYVLADRACFVVEPGILKHEAAPFVPVELREFRYPTYVSGQQAWDDTPLYLWDEWNAYINGGEAAISLYDEGLWNDGWRDQSGVIEFVAYGVAVAMAVAANDPGYFSDDVDGVQLKAMLAYLLRRSLELHRRFAGIGDFQSDTSDALYATLRDGAAAADIRAFIADTYGQAFLDEVLDL